MLTRVESTLSFIFLSLAIRISLNTILFYCENNSREQIFYFFTFIEPKIYIFLHYLYNKNSNFLIYIYIDNI